MNPLKVLCLTVCVLTGITTTFSEYMTQTISVDDKKMKISEYAFDKYPILKSFYKDQYFIDRIQNTSQCKVIFNHLKKSVQNFIEDLKKGIYTEKKDSENIRLIFMKIIDHINNKLHYGLQMDDYFLENITLKY